MQQLINDLRLSRKFLLVGRLILAMLAVPLELVLSTGLASLARSATALSGVAPAIAAAQEIQLMQLQRAQSANLLSGNEDARAPREALQARSTEAMQAQFSATQTFGNAPTEQRVRKSSNSIATGASEVATVASTCLSAPKDRRATWSSSTRSRSKMPRWWKNRPPPPTAWTSTHASWWRPWAFFSSAQTPHRWRCVEPRLCRVSVFLASSAYPASANSYILSSKTIQTLP